MRELCVKYALELKWDEICSIVSEEIESILGISVQCKVNVVEDSLWDVTFIDYRLPLSMLCQLLQATQATQEDWEDALPDEGGADVGDIGIVLAEKLVGHHLNLTWDHHLITADSLWLIGVAFKQNDAHDVELKILSELMRAVTDTMLRLHKENGSIRHNENLCEEIK